ncbi:hypothetical protein B0H17DRAFT_1161975 [Mycena rosella]|uniref:Alcohol dehydrogenase-like C-terminal domain-containing protein n=1 Tax=Mycena rosella TaxID=1033263 RepID=A0AAD7D035_MYCRO|nr:hypothetical protein B0H17DRAFT_1161975 [Mycena rosella]
MKAFVFAGKGQPIIEERPRPTLLMPTDAIVKMTMTSICVPICTFSSITSCSSYEFCRKGIPSHCVDGGWILGNTIDGTQAYYTRIPRGFQSEQVMCSDVLPTGFECEVLNGRVQPGSTVAVIGGGPVGLGALLTAQLYSPFNLIMIDLDANRLKAAETQGATHCVVSGPNTIKKVVKLTGGRGVDTAIEAVGVPATFQLCQDLVTVRGTIVNLGVHGCKVDLHLENLWDRNISTFAEMSNAYSTFGAAAEHNAL